MEYPEYVKVATDWWTEKIQNPSYNFGGTKEQNDLITFLSMISKRDFSDQELEIFNEILANNINKEIEQDGETIVRVDYDPKTSNLRQAGNVIGLTKINYPFKTFMRVNPEYVSVREGIDAENKIIWKRTLKKIK